MTASKMPDAIGEGSFEFDDTGNVSVRFAGWLPYNHYRVPKEQMLEVARRYWAMHSEVGVLREIAARFDAEADETAILAVERWEQLGKWREIALALGELVNDLVDQWPEVADDPPATRRQLELLDELVAAEAVTA